MQPRALRWICAAVALALGAGLVAYSWRSTYSRYHIDDYCTAMRLRELGFFDAMRYHRDHWSGRYAYFAIKAIPESIGPRTTKVTTSVVIALFCAAAIWAVQRAMRPGLLLAATTGLAIVFAAIDGTPDNLAVSNVLLWETGNLTYMLPLVLYCAWPALFFARGPLALRCALSALLLFVAGGLSETSLAAQGALVAGVLLFTIVRRIPGARSIAACGFAATLLSLLVSISAPGNVVRMSDLPPQPPLAEAIFHALRLTYRYVGSNVFVGGASLVAILACGLLLGRIRRDVPAFLFFALTALGAFIASLLPSTWMLSSSPPARALHVSNFFFIATLLALAAALGATRARVDTLAAVLLVLAIPITLHAAWSVAETFDEGRRHAAEMDRIDAILAASRGRDVVLRSPLALAERQLMSDPKFWANVCMCRFHGANSLSVTR